MNERRNGAQSGTMRKRLAIERLNDQTQEVGGLSETVQWEPVRMFEIGMCWP